MTDAPKNAPGTIAWFDLTVSDADTVRDPAGAILALMQPRST